MAKKAPREKPLTKSEQMSRVKSRDTEPELLVRRLLSAKGVRYRLHRRDLPGRPDLYIGRLRLALFVNGCYWHGHTCPRGRRPKTNVDFWNQKIALNIDRDERARRALHEEGVNTMDLWTCETGKFPALCRRIAERYRNAGR